MAVGCFTNADDPAAASATPAERDLVVLLHGFAGKPLLLSRLKRLLLREGFDVMHWGYPSVFRRIAQHGDQLRQDVERLARRKLHPRIHVVAHSLGGIVTRHAFAESPPEQLGRVVMLAPPNQGSHLARRAARLLGWCCPVLGELSDDPHSFVNHLGHFPPLEIGVIAASRDWVVSHRATHLSGQFEHTIVSGSHVSLPFKTRTARQIAAFLRHGRFQLSST